jgi:F0F1-type ATP synthase assembly protein I
MSVHPRDTGTPKAQPENSGRAAAEAEEIRVGWRMAGLGMEVASQVAAGALLGWVFDRWRGQGSTGLLVGAIAGIAVGLLTLIRRSIKLNRDLDARHPVSTRAKPLDDEPARDKWDDDADDD